MKVALIYKQVFEIVFWSHANWTYSNGGSFGSISVGNYTAALISGEDGAYVSFSSLVFEAVADFAIVGITICRWE
jgi:hypothetical protein